MKKLLIILLLNVASLFATTKLNVESLISDFVGVTNNDNSIIVYGNCGIILRSTNEGHNWEQIKITPDTTTILKIKNLDNVFWGIVSNGSIISSIDNGKNWNIFSSSHKFYDLNFYDDKIILLSNNSLYIYDKNFNEINNIDLNLQIQPNEFIISQDYAIIPSDTGKIFTLNLNNLSDSNEIDFASLVLCSNCKIPYHLLNIGSNVYLSNGDNILKSTNDGKNWQKFATGGGLFSVQSDTIYSLQPSIYYFKYLLTSPVLSKFINGNYIRVTKDTVKRYVVYQMFTDFRFITKGLIVAVGSNKTIYLSRNGGITWELISNISTASNTYWQSVDFGLAFGNNGLSFTTKNGGVTWTPQKFTDTTIKNFQFADAIYATKEGKCFIYNSSGNLLSRTNAMFSIDSGETFIQYNEDSLSQSSWHPTDIYKDGNGQTYIYSLISGEYYQCSNVIVVDSNFKFIRRKKFLDSATIVPRSIKKNNKNFEGFAIQNYNNDKFIRDSCQVFSIESNDGENWTQTFLCKLYGAFSTMLKLNENEFLFSMHNDTLIVDTTTHYGHAIGDYYMLYFHANTGKFDTLLKSKYYPFLSFLNYNGIIYNFGWQTIYSIDSAKLVYSNWDSIPQKPYQAGGGFIFNNILYGPASCDFRKTVMLKLTLPLTLDDVDEHTEIRTQVYAYPPYPIPAFNKIRCKIYWDLRYDINNAGLSVFDINGNIVPSEGNISIIEQESYSGEIVWDCFDKPNGIYFISFTHGDVTTIIPVIISR